MALQLLDWLPPRRGILVWLMPWREIRCLRDNNAKFRDALRKSNEYKVSLLNEIERLKLCASESEKGLEKSEDQFLHHPLRGAYTVDLRGTVRIE